MVVVVLVLVVVVEIKGFAVEVVAVRILNDAAQLLTTDESEQNELEESRLKIMVIILDIESVGGGAKYPE